MVKKTIKNNIEEIYSFINKKIYIKIILIFIPGVFFIYSAIEFIRFNRYAIKKIISDKDMSIYFLLVVIGGGGGIILLNELFTFRGITLPNFIYYLILQIIMAVFTFRKSQKLNKTIEEYIETKK